MHKCGSESTILTEKHGAVKFRIVAREAVALVEVVTTAMSPTLHSTGRRTRNFLELYTLPCYTPLWGR